VLVPDLVEEVDLILVSEQSCCDGVHRRISPSLKSGKDICYSVLCWHGHITIPYLVVEPALRVKILEELHICLAAPKFHVSNLEVAPD
jgi:hypothetical protein